MASSNRNLSEAENGRGVIGHIPAFRRDSLQASRSILVLRAWSAGRSAPPQGGWPLGRTFTQRAGFRGRGNRGLSAGQICGSPSLPVSQVFRTVQDRGTAWLQTISLISLWLTWSATTGRAARFQYMLNPIVITRFVKYGWASVRRSGIEGALTYNVRRGARGAGAPSFDQPSALKLPIWVPPGRHIAAC